MSDLNFKSLSREMAGKQKGSSSILLLTIITLVAVIVMWAATTELDNVVRGSGTTVSEARNQMVQSSEPGVITQRYVAEGDFVKKDQVLFDIDPVDTKTQLDQAQKRFTTLTIKAIRLKAEVNNEIPKFDTQLIEIAPETITTELALYRARLEDLKTRTAILDQRRIQKLNEIEELKIQYNTANRGLQLIQKEISTLEPLVKTGLAPETRLISLRREEENSIGQANSAEVLKLDCQLD